LGIDLVKSNSVSLARLTAFEILRRVAAGAYASVLLAAREPELAAADRALCHELVMGVLRQQLWLDRLIESYTKRKVAGFDEAVRIALRLGLYQLRFLSRIPAAAAVNESVNLVHLARLRSAASLVNAILRRATREPEVDPTSNIQDPIERISVATSHPRWLIERWIAAFGSQQAEAFAHANNEAALIAFRVVQNRASAEDVCEQLREAGAELLPSKVAAGARRISGAGKLLGEFAAAGKVYIQDEASQLVALLLDVQPGDRVLDLCAAPGSKTSQIADLSLDSALILATDLHEHRLRTLVSLAELQRLRSIHCVALDGVLPLPVSAGAFDRVLVDAPCSGTGTLRRNPEIRWRISPADIKDLAGRQTQLLFNAAAAVRPGGRLVYSTCSVELEENEEVVKTFLENNESFRAVELNLGSLQTSAGAARTWPQRDGTDGFFVCVFERKGRS
jgi:16S rRNA (cytosine967-C5)-methyltransferase